MMTASAPGKLIIAGEYAVLQGGPAVVVAVNRRVVATIGERTMASPFLAAVTAALAEEFGDDDEITQRSLAIHIDSSALYLDGAKLGLGSSAAVTVAAVALAIGNTTNNLPRIYRIAAHAHAEAQGARGARGSGADIAAAVFGGALQFQRSGAHSQLPWPGHNDDVAWIPCFLGAPADTLSTLPWRPSPQRQRASLRHCMVARWYPPSAPPPMPSTNSDEPHKSISPPMPAGDSARRRNRSVAKPSRPVLAAATLQ